MTYQTIVNISNEIRFVMSTSRQVNLAAQNASLAARRAGDARGFQAVSQELKRFSQGLSAAMDSMVEEVLSVAQGISNLYRHQRLYRQQRIALNQCRQNSRLGESIEKSERRREKLHIEFNMCVRNLQRRLVCSQQLCSNGRALARSALIEANGAGEVESILKNVAQDIECTIEDIHNRLKKIGACLEEEVK